MLGCTLLAVACTKSSSSSTTSPTSTTTTTSYPNKLTVVDNGTTYTAEGIGTTPPSGTPAVILVVQKYSNNSIFQINTYLNTFKDFYLELIASEGPVSGIGTFVIRKDSHSAGCSFIEKFNGGLTYKIDTGVITTTSCSSSNVSGTYTLWLSNSSGNKTVTGSFNCNQPSIL
jgi:hypothetical protein